MTSFRNRILAAFLFGLLSLGQAYPYSVAWAAPAPQSTCCCAMMKKKGACHCRHAGRMSCHRDARPGFSSAPCGARADVGSLNFSGEPCLPRSASFSFADDLSFDRPRPHAPPHEFPVVPEPPPPRGRALS